MSKMPVSTMQSEFEQNRMMETETRTYNAIGLGDIWVVITKHTRPQSIIKTECTLNTPYGGEPIGKMDIANLIMLLAHVLNELE